MCQLNNESHVENTGGGNSSSKHQIRQMWKEPEETLNLQVAVKHTRMTQKCLFSCFPARETSPIAVIHNSKIFRTGMQMTARH